MSVLSPKQHRAAGFTLPELIVVIAVMSLLMVTIVGTVLVWFGQYAVGNARQVMTSDTRSALSRMSTDIRQSHMVLVENAEIDPHAPAGPTKWLTSADQLVLGKTPRDSSGNGLYDATSLYSGTPDSIVYYVSGGSLYRRVVPANYAGNVSLPLITCGVQTGGCPLDAKILGNVTSVQFTYYDNTNTSGAAPAVTKSVMVTVQTSRQQSGQTITINDNLRMSLQSLAAIVPPPPSGGTDPPPAPQTSAGLAVGPGGLQVNFSQVTGRDIYVKGRLILGNLTSISTNNRRMDVANMGCGSGAAYPTLCVGQQPIGVSFLSDASANPICATGQTVTMGLTGLQAGCTAPAATMPAFNKAAFTSSMMTNSGPLSCSFFGSLTIPANRRINGNLSASGCGDLIFQGNTYITGDLTASGLSTIRVADGVTARPVIVVDGRVNLSFTTIEPNNRGVTPYIYSFYSTDSVCSASPSCTTLSNSDLYDTVNSSNSAINVSMMSDVSASLYAYFGTVTVSSSDVTGAIAGQRVNIGMNSGVQLTRGIWPG